MQFIKMKKTAVSFVLLFIIIIYFHNATVIMEAVKDGLLLCYNKVIPSLFIFMVLSNIISCSDLCDYIAIPFMPFFKLLKINNRKIASCCVLGIIGGFATGALMLDQIHNEFDCDNNTLELLSVIVSNNSPAFVILAVGIYYLGNIYTGMLIYFAVLISSMITAFFLSFIHQSSNNNICKNKLAYTNNIILSIKSATSSIINICGIVTLTYTLCKVISPYINIPLILAIFSSLIEVTTACEYSTALFGKNIYLLSLILSVCPLSTYLQLKSIGNNNTLNLKIILYSKIIQIPVMLLILRTLLNLFPQAINVYLSQDVSVNLYWNTPEISLCFLILSVCFVLITDNKLKVFTIREK